MNVDAPSTPAVLTAPALRPLNPASTRALPRRPSSSATQSSTSEPTVKVFLQFDQEPYREAYLYRENTLAQLKQAVRTAFGLPPSQALLLHCNDGATALHRLGNQDMLHGLIQSGDVIRISLSDRNVTPKKSPRLFRITKRMGRSWRQKRQDQKLVRGVLPADGDSSLGSTPPSTLPPPLLHSHHRAVSEVSVGSGSIRSIVAFPSHATPPSSPPLHPQLPTPPPPLAPVMRQQSSSSSGGGLYNANTRSDVFRAFYCPIMLHLMADPVTAEDGVTYDRPAIEGFFARLRQEKAETLERNNTVGDTDDDDDDEYSSDDDLSIPATPAVHVLTVLWSPMTREVISDTLVPNRSIEQMIVDAVENGQANVSEADLKDWRSRRTDKMELDRQRALARKLLRYGTDEGVESSGHGESQSFRLLVDSAALFPVDTLQRLVRVDRPHPSDRMGGCDSGLAVVAVGDIEAKASLCIQSVTYCAVGCCVNSVAPNTELWCPRCQRVVCRDCRRTQVTDIRTANSSKPYEVCCECILQLADVLVSNSDSQAKNYRLTLLQNHVLPRFQDCWAVVLSLGKGGGSRARTERESDQSSRINVNDSLTSESHNVPDPEGVVEAQETTTISCGSTGNDAPKESAPPKAELRSRAFLPECTTALASLGMYPATPDGGNPLHLSFPSPSMRHLLMLISREQHQLNGDNGEAAHDDEAFWAKSNARISSAFLAYEPPASPTLATAIPSLVDGDSIALRMCPFCRAGPYEKAPDRGCFNCGGGQAQAFDQFPAWDEIAGPH